VRLPLLGSDRGCGAQPASAAGSAGGSGGDGGFGAENEGVAGASTAPAAMGDALLAQPPISAAALRGPALTSLLLSLDLAHLIPLASLLDLVRWKSPKLRE